MAAHDLPEDAFEIVVIKTSGDQIQDRPLSEVGGKGLFTKEIEEALLDGRISSALKARTSSRQRRIPRRRRMRSGASRFAPAWVAYLVQ